MFTTFSRCVGELRGVVKVCAQAESLSEIQAILQCNNSSQQDEIDALDKEIMRRLIWIEQNLIPVLTGQRVQGADFASEMKVHLQSPLRE